MLQSVPHGAVSPFSTLISHQSLLELYSQTPLQSQAVLSSVLLQEYSSSRYDDWSQIVLGVVRLSLIPFEGLPLLPSLLQQANMGLSLRVDSFLF